METVVVVIYLIAYIALSCILFIPALIVWLINLPFDREVRWLNSYRFWWGRLYFNISPGWTVSAEGMENIDAAKQYIVVMNHQSALDIPFSTFIRSQFNWVSKFEVLYIPVIGWLMWMCRDIPIKRGTTKSTRMMMHAISEKIANGKSVLLYPEGTRTRDGKVKHFKEGAFVVAKSNKVGILPVVIEGTFDAMPRGKFGFRLSQEFRMKVLPEVSFESIKDLTPRQVAEQLEVMMRTVHQEMAPEKYK